MSGAGGIQTLRGHAAEVYICSWNPVRPLIASGSGDGTARIWSVPNTRPPAVLHETSMDRLQNDVSTLDWNSTGTHLATGSVDGVARIWTEQGALSQSLKRHEGPIFALKWNRSGDKLLTGSADKSTIVWDTTTGQIIQRFDHHTDSTLDVDWRDDRSFASCSSDKTVQYVEIGRSRPTRVFHGHTNEVNALQWDSGGSLLASCSDDRTVRIWSPNSDKSVTTLSAHTKEIYTIRWAPSATLLASASLDSSVIVWDIATECPRWTLSGHSQSVYSVAFSPDGNLLASGSFDSTVSIWSVKSGALVRTIPCSGGVYEVNWNPSGTSLAACCASKEIYIFDVRM